MKINRTLLPLLLVCLMAAFNTACQRSDNGVQAAREDKMTPADKHENKAFMSDEDKNIAVKIEESNQGEVDLARLAENRANNSDVKGFAEMVADDHTNAIKDLNKMTEEKNAGGESMNKPAEAKRDLSELEKLNGDAFDREFLSMMVSDHQKTLDALRNFQMTAQNPDLKDYINNLIPKVQKHLDDAQDLMTKMTKNGTL